jgi:branched-chain amino acid transport system permease protein
MRSWLILLIGVAALAALPLVGSNYALRLGTQFAMYAVLALSWNFIGGMAGYPSFATAAFFGLGAYASGILQGLGLLMPLAWLAAGLLAALFAGVIGLAILHLKGHYFAIASLAIAEILRELINANADFTGGGMGLNLPILKVSIAAQAQLFYAAMLALAAAAAAATIAVPASRLGFGLRCIQQNEDAAVMLGVDARLYKTAAFALSAVFVGVAGGIYANWVRYIEPGDVFDILLAVKPLVMVLIGGLGTLFGPVIGAAVYLVLEEAVWRNFLTIHAAALGLIIVALILFLPGGIAAIRVRANRAKPRGAA